MVLVPSLRRFPALTFVSLLAMRAITSSSQLPLALPYSWFLIFYFGNFVFQPQPEEKNLTSLLNLLFKKNKTIPLTSCLSQANFIAEGEGNITQDQIENLSTELKVCGPRVISSLVDIEWEPKVFQAWGICGNHWFSQGFWQECFLVDLKFRATFLFSTSGTWPQASNRNIGHWTNQGITNLNSNI